MDLSHAISLGLTVLAIAATGQSVLGWLALRLHLARARAVPAAAPLPPISVLKPLHGNETLLEEALSGFCTQDYPVFQLVFGVQSVADPAIATVRRLRERFPELPIDLVVDPTGHGANHKIGNLLNMLPRARHDVLVIADSDMHVGPDYLRRVAATLGEPGTGLATAVYAGRPVGTGLADRLGAAAINQIFAPGVLLARALGRQDCMGATMALTRETLARCGGLQALAPYVADDAVLGRRVRALGLAVRLIPAAPATTVAEPGLPALFRHELRWGRTIRAVAPVGYASSVLQLPLALGVLACIWAPDAAWSWGTLGLAWAIRAACSASIERGMGVTRTPAWLLPVRDLLSLAVLLSAYAGREVAWRGRTLDMSAEAQLVPRQRLERVG